MRLLEAADQPLKKAEKFRLKKHELSQKTRKFAKNAKVRKKHESSRFFRQAHETALNVRREWIELGDLFNDFGLWSKPLFQ